MRSALLPAGAVCALAVAVLVPNLPANRVPSEDAGVFLYIAHRMLDGGLPYRDVWDHKPPGVYVVDAVGLALGGGFGVWLVQLAFLAGAGLIGLRALAPFGARPALFGSAAWLVAAPRLFLADGTQTTYVELFALPLQFATYALFASEIARPRVTWRSAAIGALAGGSFLFKPTLVGTALAAGILFMVARRRTLPASLGAMLAAGAGMLALAAVPFAAAGALGEAVDQVVRYNAVYSAFASPADRLAAVAGGLRLTAPSGLSLIAAGAWLYAVPTRRTAPPVLALAVLALPIELLLASAGRGYHYYFIAWLPAMGVLAAFGASEVERRLDRRTARAVILVAAIAMSVRPAMLVTRLAAERDDGVARSAAAYIADATRSTDTVFLWGSRVETLVLADRLAPTRYVYQYAALETRGYATPARVAELTAELAGRPPVLIIDASRDSFVTPPLDRAAFRAWTSPEPQYAPLPELERVIDFVETAYERVGTVPGAGWPVWRRRGS